MARRRQQRAKQVALESRAAPSYRLRRRFVLGCFALLAVAVTWRAVDQQIFERDFLQAEGADRYLDTVEIPVHRGVITDRHGELLAVSTPVESVGARPAVLLKQGAALPRLAGLLALDEAGLRRRLEQHRHRRFVYLRRGVTPEQADAVRALVAESGLRGLRLEREYRRYYPAGEVFGHVIGFTDVDDRGQEGIELAYDAELRGEPGLKRVLRDGRRQVVADVEQVRMPRPGRHLALSLDSRIQFIAYRELKAAVTRHRARAGSIVILNAATGEVLAMANQPAFNPNGNRSSRNRRLVNRALVDVFEPGSTMKTFTVAAALESGRYTPQTEIDTSPGWFRLGRARVRDHRNLGVIDLTTLLQKSSNVGAGRIALDLPQDALWGLLNGLGFGQPPGTGFPGEATGRLQPPDDWALIDQATLSFGYGLSTSTLQLARAYAALAAGGVSRPVSLLKRDEPPPGRRVFSTRTSRELLTMLESVILPGGTATQAALPGYRVAGKTGTVKKAVAGGYADDRYLSIFAGIAPIDGTPLAAVVMIDEPGGEEYYGGAVAAPVFAAVLDDALRILNIPPDARPPEPIRLADAETSI